MGPHPVPTFPEGLSEQVYAGAVISLIRIVDEVRAIEEKATSESALADRALAEARRLREAMGLLTPKD